MSALPLPVSPPLPVQAEKWTGIQRLQGHHLRMVELRLSGLKNVEIAKVMKMSPENVSLVLSSPLFQDELAKRREQRNRIKDEIAGVQENDANRILADAESTAAQTMSDLLQSQDEKMKFSAAKDILDRRGLGKGTQVPVTHITIDRLNLLVQAQNEAEQLSVQPSTGVTDE